MSEPEQEGWEEVLPFPEVYIKVEPQEVEMKVGTNGTGHFIGNTVCSLYIWFMLVLQGTPARGDRGKAHAEHCGKLLNVVNFSCHKDINVHT